MTSGASLVFEYRICTWEQKYRMLTLTPPSPYIVRFRVATELHEAKAKDYRVISGNEPHTACSRKGKARRLAIRLMVYNSRHQYLRLRTAAQNLPLSSTALPTS